MSPGMEVTASPGSSTTPFSEATFSFYAVGISLNAACVRYLIFPLCIIKESSAMSLLPLCSGKLQLDPT